MKKLILASVAALALCATSAFADEAIKKAGKGTIKLDVRVTAVVPDESGDILTAAGADSGLDVAVNDSYVPTIGLEYYLTDNVSIEAIAGTANHTVKAVNATTNVKVMELWHLPPTVTAKYHFKSESKLTPYVGAGLTYIWFYSEAKKNGFDVNLKDGFGYALQLGADYDLKGPWSLNFDVKKIMFETDADINAGALKSAVTLDPLVASVGFGYKF